MLLGTPEVLHWSREVVMDVPSMAFLLLAAAALLQYQETKRSPALLVAVLLTLAAVYTKQTAIFVTPAFAAVLLADEGWALGRRKSTWILAATGVLGIAPLMLFTVFYAPEVFHIAVGTGTGQREYARLSWRALIAYGAVSAGHRWDRPARGIGRISGMGRGAGLARPGRAPADAVDAGVVRRRLSDDFGHRRFRDALRDAADGAAGRAVHPADHPAVLGPVGWIHRAPRRRGPVRRAARDTTGTSGRGLRRCRAIRAGAYESGRDRAVPWHGLEEFHVFRADTQPCTRIFIMRAEKSLVDYSIMRDWGIKDRNVSAAEMASLIDRDNVAYIVFQPNFWTDQPSIAALQRLIDSERFALVAQFGITSDEPSRSKVLRVYRVKRDPTPTLSGFGPMFPPVPAITPGR